MKKVLHSAFFVVGVASVALAAGNDLLGEQDDSAFVRQCRESLLATFPNTKVDRIEKSLLPGLCEISSGTNVLYFHPQGADGYLIAGSILDKTGRNYTEEKSQVLLVDKINSLPREKSIIQGEGPVDVIIFTDVDCPFCRDLEKGLSLYPDLFQKATLHTFLYPLSMHPDAVPKSRWILCQRDKARALRDVMVKGVLDDEANPKPDPMDCAPSEVDLLLAAAMESGKGIGLRGTPAIFVNGIPVRGDAERVYDAITVAFQRQPPISGISDDW